MREVIYEMSRKKLGMTCVVDDAARSRRHHHRRRPAAAHDRDTPQLLRPAAADVMTRNPITIASAHAGGRGPATRSNATRSRRSSSSTMPAAVQGVVHLHDLWHTEMDSKPRESPQRDHGTEYLLSPVLARPAGRPCDRQGLGALQAARRRWIDRRRAPRDAALHARPQLPRRQPGRSGDRGAHRRRAPRHRRARDPDDPRQPVPREGPGRARDPGHQALLQRPN